MTRKPLLPRVKALKIEDPYKLILTFTNNEVRIYDMRQYFDENPQDKLRNKRFFNTAYISFGAIEWCNDFSICADVLYTDSQPVVTSNLIENTK